MGHAEREAQRARAKVAAAVAVRAAVLSGTQLAVPSQVRLPQQRRPEGSTTPPGE